MCSLFFSLSFSLFFCLSLCLFVFLSLRVCLSLTLSLSFFLSVCLSVSVSVSLSLCLSLCLSLSLSFSPDAVPEILLSGHNLIVCTLDFLMVAQLASLLHKVVIAGWELLQLPWVRGWVTSSTGELSASLEQVEH